MTVQLLAAPHGKHCPKRDPHPVAEFFRRAVAAVRRRTAAPGAEGSLGAATTALLGEPVLGDAMLGEVRRDWDARPMSADLPTGAFARLDEKFEALYRPVNGRYLGTQPRRQPVYGERCQRDVLEAERDAAREAGNRARVRYQPASPELLERVLGGLRGMDVAG